MMEEHLMTRRRVRAQIDWRACVRSDTKSRSTPLMHFERSALYTQKPPDRTPELSSMTSSKRSALTTIGR